MTLTDSTNPAAELERLMHRNGATLEELRLIGEIRAHLDAQAQALAIALSPSARAVTAVGNVRPPRDGALGLSLFLRAHGWEGSVFYGTRRYLLDPQPTLLAAARLSVAWWRTFRLEVM